MFSEGSLFMLFPIIDVAHSRLGRHADQSHSVCFVVEQTPDACGPVPTSRACASHSKQTGQIISTYVNATRSDLITLQIICSGCKCLCLSGTNSSGAQAFALEQSHVTLGDEICFPTTRECKYERAIAQKSPQQTTQGAEALKGEVPEPRPTGKDREWLPWPQHTPQQQ